MIYRLPELTDKEILWDYVREHYESAESHISASLAFASSNYEEWLEQILKNAQDGDKDWGRSLLYLCLEGEKLIGLLSIRYELPEDQTAIYGDIGYGVRPSERNKGYATKMLEYSLKVCREKGMKEVVIGCYADNVASASVIKKNGGILIRENDNYKAGKLSQYYVISL